MTRRPRKLFPEERELWDRVVGSATPLHPEPLRHPSSDEMARPVKRVEQLPEFRIGEAVKRPQTRIDLQPSPGERIALHAIRMDRSAHRQMKRGRIAPEARIDLHGMTLAEAHPALIRFMLKAHAGGLRLVLVITGKGKMRDEGGPIPARIGALRHQVPHWLASPPLSSAVLQVATAHLRHGGEGAYYVYLRRSG